MWIYCFCLKALFASKSAVENVAHGIELHWLTESLGLGLVIMRPEFQWLLDTLFQDKMHCPFTRTSIYLLLKVKLFYNQQPKNRFQLEEKGVLQSASRALIAMDTQKKRRRSSKQIKALIRL